ncbi:hypothetical protein ACA910_022336 [Epithemia clementina (nom. ined.)]
MDHLKTTEERKARWYSKLWPRYVKVQTAAQVSDLFQPFHDASDKKDNDGDDGEDDLVVYSLDWEMMIHYLTTTTTKRATKDHSSNDNNQRHDKKNSDSENVAETSLSSSQRSLLMNVIQQHGFAIVSNVLSQDECDHALHLAQDWIQAACYADHVTIEKRVTTPRTMTITSTSTCGTEKNQVSQQQQQQQQQQGEIEQEQEQQCAKNAEVETTRTAPSTSSSSSFSFPKSVLEGGMIPFYGSGHSTFAWYVRSRPKLVQMFQALYRNSDVNSGGDESNDEYGYDDCSLLTSLDGIVLWPSLSTPTTTGDAGWFHVDQNPCTKPNFCSVQGLVNLLPTTPQTGGNALVVESHKFFPHHYCCRRCNNDNDNHDDDQNDHDDLPCLFYPQRLLELNGDDWMEVDPLDQTVLNPDKIISCLLRPGDVLLWDSRTVHCSYPGIIHDHHGKQPPPMAAKQPTTKTITVSTKEHEETFTKSRVQDKNGTETATPPHHHRNLTTANNNHHHHTDDDGDDDDDRGHVTTLIRAATTVTMMPVANHRIPDHVRQARQDACSLSSLRTLTHWVDKVQPLGDERPEVAALEQARIQAMLEWEQQQSGGGTSRRRRRKVLLDFEALTQAQKELVVGQKPKQQQKEQG